jgi:hypothetical protein
MKVAQLVGVAIAVGIGVGIAWYRLKPGAR